MAAATGAKLEKASIQIAKTGAKVVDFRFNPKEYTLAKSATWERKPSKANDQASTAEFKGADPRTLTVELFLDESESSVSVHAQVEKLLECCTPTGESIGKNKPKPPFVLFTWGRFFSFRAYIESVTAKYTLFRADGSPIRATCSLKMTEAPEPKKKTNPTSGALSASRERTIAAGDTLQSIAWEEYDDPNRWRELAACNGIDDPFRVLPGTRLLIPAIDEILPAREPDALVGS